MANQIWLLLSHAVGNMGRHAGYFEALARLPDDHLAAAKRLISLDVERTARGLTPEIKEAISRVLLCFAKRNAEVGYCQGMNFICYFLIEMGFEEEQAFWLITHLVENVMPYGFYVNMTPVIADLEIFRHILQERQPWFYREVTRKGFDLQSLLVPFFVTLFTNLKNKEVG